MCVWVCACVYMSHVCVWKRELTFILMTSQAVHPVFQLGIKDLWERERERERERQRETERDRERQTDRDRDSECLRECEWERERESQDQEVTWYFPFFVCCCCCCFQQMYTYIQGYLKIYEKSTIVLWGQKFFPDMNNQLSSQSIHQPHLMQIHLST